MRRSTPQTCAFVVTRSACSLRRSRSACTCLALQDVCSSDQDLAMSVNDSFEIKAHLFVSFSRYRHCLLGFSSYLFRWCPLTSSNFAGIMYSGSGCLHVHFPIRQSHFHCVTF